MAVQKKTYTLAEYEQIQALPENRDKLLELIDGQIVEKVASYRSSKTAAQLIKILAIYLDEHNVGDITSSDGTYVMSEDNALIPDVGIIRWERLPEDVPRAVPVHPDFAVEVKSPTDSKREMRRKAEKYLWFGTQLVWLVFPDEQLVEVYVPDHDVEVYGVGDILDGADVLPEFSLPVEKIFINRRPRP